MPSPLHLTLRRWTLAGVCVSACLGAGCPEPRPRRSIPVCAVQDCKTGEILDDGCADDGKCQSCINDCGGRVAPRAPRKP